jgi:flagellar biogenesis protein FliO
VSADFDWARMMVALGLILALFLFPVVSLWLDSRKESTD